MSTSFTSYVVKLSTFLWFGVCNHCILAYLWSKKRRHSSSNLCLCCFISLVEILMFSLMFSKALFMSSLWLKFSTAANLFEISVWYYFLTSSSFSFLRLNLSTSKFCDACLLTANLSLTLQPPDSDRYHRQLNRPDIIIKNKKERTYILIDVAVPSDKNVVQKEAEKQLIHSILCTEIQ